MGDVIEFQVIGPVLAALDDAANTLPDASEWKWACLGIRRHMAGSVGLPASPQIAHEPTEEPNGIKELRVGRGLSKRQLAEEIGVDKSTFSRWEAGGAIPDWRKQQIAECLRVSVPFLMRWGRFR